ncbi:MAG: hypothetical protein CYPHOPRED_000546 [Cyphobasidiales sp. Tagirdzhanova-0007]|nr:MAG: hypothetical protein CYPHOPRED_000546 [Cyphobasidiales sp. Tagirdzhanova-0007]
MATPLITPIHENYLEIPCRDSFLPGTLAQANPATRSNTVAVILHGQMAHRDQLYHKSLVRALIEYRQMDSVRFDFTHAKYGASDWKWHMARFHQDIEELQFVVDYLAEMLGYEIRLLIGHSKGALASFAYLSKIKNPPPFYVNLSGRYDMKRANDIMGPRYFPAFEKAGLYEWNAKVAGRQVVAKITPEQFREFVNHDTSFINSTFAVGTHVLTLHGDADPLVPVEDGKMYHFLLSQRPGPGTSTLHLVQGGDHNYIGHFEEVVKTILDWLNRVDPINDAIPAPVLGLDVVAAATAEAGEDALAFIEWADDYIGAEYIQRIAR